MIIYWNITYTSSHSIDQSEWSSHESELVSVNVVRLASLPRDRHICRRPRYKTRLQSILCSLFVIQFLKYTTRKMSYKGPQKVQKVMVQPINLIFRYLQNRSRVQVWLFENVNLRIEGHIVGFDEYMNLVLDDAEEYHQKTKNRKQLGRIMLKGDNITLIQNTNPGAN